jgi:5-methyltetrahydrofolate--homocysteine methyltransferase
VEVDGSPHQEAEIKRNDNQRSAWLKEQGYKVLRFWNSDVTNNIDVVLEKITRETMR